MGAKTNKTDIRHEYLSKLVNKIFDTKVNSIDRSKDNKVIVIRGRGKEIGKCSFTELYRKDFTKLFEYTFTYEQCEFRYDGAQKAKQRFDRSIAIKNAIIFFSEKNIMLNYVFHSRAEGKLFSRLIYRYIKKLLDVLFDEYFISDKKEFEEAIAEKYEKSLAQIRDEVDTTDIHELIYKNAKLSDAELLSFDDNADSVMLVDNGYEYILHYSSYGMVTPLKLRPIDQRSVFSRSDIFYNIYSIGSEASIPIIYTPNIDYYPIKILDFKRIEFFVPRFFCVRFKLSEISTSLADELEDKKISIYDELAKKVYEHIIKEYISIEKQETVRLECLEEILEIILQINYRELFKNNRYLENHFKLGLARFCKFLDISNIEKGNELILFRYLLSLWVDEFSHTLLCMLADQEYKIIIKGKSLLKHLKMLSDYVKTKNLGEANKAFFEFYNYNKRIIDTFKEKVDLMNLKYFNVSFEENIHNGYGPYLHLKEALNTYYEFISTTDDKLD